MYNLPFSTTLNWSRLMKHALLGTLLFYITLLPVSAKLPDAAAQDAPSHATLTPAAQNSVEQNATAEKEGESPLYGYTPASSRIERDWENKLRAIPEPKIMRDSM